MPASNPRKKNQPDKEAIGAHAYEIWQREGCPTGRSLQHWLTAEAALRAESQDLGKARSESLPVISIVTENESSRV